MILKSVVDEIYYQDVLIQVVVTQPSRNIVFAYHKRKSKEKYK